MSDPFDPAKLKPGLYVLHWKTGGTSQAAVGQWRGGGHWFAPTNWISGSSADWSMVEKVDPLWVGDGTVYGPGPVQDIFRRHAAAEALKSEILSTLGQLVEAFEELRHPPAVVQYIPPADGGVAQEVVEALAAQQGWQGPLTVPSGATYTFTAEPAVTALADALRRLAWLLGLSDAERAFVDEAASAARGGRPADACETLLVYADWLEDNFRGPHGEVIRRLAFRDGDLLVLRLPAYDNPAAEPHEEGDAWLRAQGLIDGLESRFGLRLGSLVLRHGEEVAAADLDDLRHLGWERSRSLLRDRLQEEVAGEVEDVPGVDAELKAARLIGRLKRQADQAEADRAAAVLAEREACARVADAVAQSIDLGEDGSGSAYLAVEDVADRIRGRPRP